MISTIFTLVIAFLSLIVLMIIHEFGHFIIAKKFGVRVDEFGIGYPPRLFGKRFRETIYSVNLLPLGAFVRIYGEDGDSVQTRNIDDYRNFSNLAIWKRVLIVIGGVAAFWIASIILFSVVFSIGANVPIGDEDVAGLANTRVTIVSVRDNSAAREAGILKNDVISGFKIGGEEIAINKIKDVQNTVAANQNKEITLLINREGENFEVLLTPKPLNQGEQAVLGVELERVGTLIEKHTWYVAPFKGLVYTGEITLKAFEGIYMIFKSLFAGKGVPEGAELAGPVGITIFLARAVDFGIGFFLYFIAAISVFVAIFNLFPIPALDGGKLLFLAIEKIKRKPVSAKVEQSITAVFFFILIIMSIFVTVQFDFPRIADFWNASLSR